MGSFSLWHWLIVLLVVVLIFGTKRLRSAGSDLGAAAREFKRAAQGEPEAQAPAPGAPDAPAPALNPPGPSAPAPGEPSAPSASQPPKERL